MRPHALEVTFNVGYAGVFDIEEVRECHLGVLYVQLAGTVR
jgi:hypothetical protein